MNPPGKQWFHDVGSALGYSMAHPHENQMPLMEGAGDGFAPPHNDLTGFILRQHSQMPDYLRAPMLAATLGFDALGQLRGGKTFHRQSQEQRARQIVSWKNSGIEFLRDLFRYFESLATLALYSRGREGNPLLAAVPAANDTHSAPPPANELRAEIAIIGSGPGGAITACLLAEAERDVLLIEEGHIFPSVPAHRLPWRKCCRNIATVDRPTRWGETRSPTSRDVVSAAAAKSPAACITARRRKSWSDGERSSASKG